MRRPRRDDMPEVFFYLTAASGTATVGISTLANLGASVFFAILTLSTERRANESDENISRRYLLLHENKTETDHDREADETTITVQEQDSELEPAPTNAV